MGIFIRRPRIVRKPRLLPRINKTVGIGPVRVGPKRRRRRRK